VTWGLGPPAGLSLAVSSKILLEKMSSHFYCTIETPFQNEKRFNKVIQRLIKNLQRPNVDIFIFSVVSFQLLAFFLVPFLIFFGAP
jgi:hypothetical protein